MAAYVDRPIEVKNAGAEAIPPFGVVYPDDIPDGAAIENGKSYLKVKKPDATYRREYLINGEISIEPGHFGKAYYAYQSPVWALVNTVDDTAKSYGPKASSFELWPLLYGFRPYTTYAEAFAEYETKSRILCIQSPPHLLNGKFDKDNTKLDVWSRDLSVNSAMAVDLDMSLFDGDDYDDALEMIAGYVGDDWMLLTPKGCPN